jgi:hypothetical protein
MPSGKRWSWGLFADNLWPAVFAGLVTPVVHANRGALDSVDLEETAGTPFHAPLDDMGKNRPKRPVTLVWSGRNRKSPWIGRGASEGSTLGGGL